LDAWNETRQRDLWTVIRPYPSNDLVPFTEGEKSMIKTIVVPTDGSSHAKKAVDLAAEIAEKHDARIVILHVLMRYSSKSDIESMCEQNAMPSALAKKLEEFQRTHLAMEVTPYEPGPIFMHLPDSLLAEVGDLVLENARKRARSKGVKAITTHVLDGSPADAIVAAADKEDADMIVMGSRGLRIFADVLMGSVSHKVSHLSKCTCVTVK
jgi:nucleotide-binding universal stress UspA family protein